MKNLYLVYFSVIILFQSCAVYKNAPASSSESNNKDSTKISSTEDGHYLNPNEKDSIELIQSQISDLYLKKPVVYRVWVKFNNEDKLNGVLYSVNDSSIVIASPISGKKYTNKIEDYYSNRYKKEEYPVRYIERIKTRRLNSIGRGAGAGALIVFGTGVALGTYVGLSGYKPAYIIGVVVGAGYSVFGGATGALIGSFKKFYTINGNPSYFRYYHRTLTELSIVK